MLSPRSTHFPVHPIHILGKPIASHERHTFPQLTQHGVQLRTAWTHSHHHLAAFLAHCGGERKVITINVESLRKGKGFAAVDGVPRARTEVTGMGFDFRVAPLVALPVWMTVVVSGAGVVCDLLHSHVSLIHVELSTTAQSREALSIAVIVGVLASRGPWHANQVEIQIAAAGRTISSEIDVNAESLSGETGHVEIVLLAVISCGVLHEVESIWRRVLDSTTTVDGGSTW